MVKCIGKLSLLLKCLKESWMDMPPVTYMMQDQRQALYRTDVTQENVIRATRQEATLDSDIQDTYNRWLRSQEQYHGSLFPVSEHLATLMFIVASDLGEAQRERYSQVPFLSKESMSLVILLTQ